MPAAIFNLLTYWWLKIHPDVFMFNLLTFFVLPCILVGIIILTVIISLFKKNCTKKELVLKFVLIILLVLVIFQYNTFTNEIVV